MICWLNLSKMLVAIGITATRLVELSCGIPPRGSTLCTPVTLDKTRQTRSQNLPPEQAKQTPPAQTAAHRLPSQELRGAKNRAGAASQGKRHRHRVDGDGRRSPAGAAAGGGAPVLRALRGAADGDQEGPQPLRRRLRHHGRQRRRGAQGQGRHLQHPEPPHHPRRRRDAPPHHARKGVQYAPPLGGVQRGQHKRRRPALHREDNFADPTQDGDGCLLGWKHRAACLRLQDQGQLLRQVLRLLPWRLQHHGSSNEP